MSAAVKLPAIFSGVKSRKDRSYRLEFDTRELGADAAELLKIHGSECWLLIAPDDSLDAVEVPNTKPDVGTGQRTPGQRLRAVLFVTWQQVGKPGDFEDYYRTRMNRIIDQLKAKLDGEEIT
jgi:hypothetical protein